MKQAMALQDWMYEFDHFIEINSGNRKFIKFIILSWLYCFLEGSLLKYNYSVTIVLSEMSHTHMKTLLLLLLFI